MRPNPEELDLVKSLENSDVYPIFIISEHAQVLLGTKVSEWDPEKDALAILEWISSNLPLETRQHFFNLIMKKAADLLIKL